MAQDIAGRVVLITGAGNGFGRLTAIRLAALGARVACLDIDAAAAEETAGAIRAAGGDATAQAADVTAIADMRAAVANAVARFGAVDVLVNSAGIMPLAFLADHAQALDAWHRCIDINLKGTLNGCVAVHDQMLAQGRGHIVNLSSIYGNRPTIGAAVYGATKAAVDYLSHALRQESRGRIKVSVIKPTGVMATGLAGSVVNPAAGAGIVGQNAAQFYADYTRYKSGDAGALADPDSIAHAFLAPEAIAEAIVYAICQPWGIAISDITVRASGDHYLP